MNKALKYTLIVLGIILAIYALAILVTLPAYFAEQESIRNIQRGIEFRRGY